MAEKCQHAGIETEIQHAYVGRQYAQIGVCTYCPECRVWSSRTSMFLDGQFYKTDAAAMEAQREINRDCKAQREAWVREHYPEHAA